jgi:hypothetical protein
MKRLYYHQVEKTKARKLRVVRIIKSTGTALLEHKQNKSIASSWLIKNKFQKIISILLWNKDCQKAK